MIERIFRVLRGGSWFDSPLFLRASSRSRYEPDYRLIDTGFRLVIVDKEQ